MTKYKARRRSAELKLEAAQQNLTRIDDIVFEVEKQRGTLKRQAAKARRYQKLRDELRRWEKVLFARKYRQLAETIESARARLTEARERESIAARASARSKPDLGRLRIELVEAETLRDRVARSRARARARDQPSAAADCCSTASRSRRSTLATTTVAAELDALEARREPAQAALAGATGRRGAGQRRARSRPGGAGRGLGRLRSRAPRNRRPRSRRRSGAQRSVLRDQLGDGAAPCARACRRGARSCRRNALEARRRSE